MTLLKRCRRVCKHPSICLIINSCEHSAIPASGFFFFFFFFNMELFHLSDKIIEDALFSTRMAFSTLFPKGKHDHEFGAELSTLRPSLCTECLVWMLKCTMTLLGCTSLSEACFCYFFFPWYFFFYVDGYRPSSFVLIAVF